MKRVRGPGGRFLTADQVAAMNEEEGEREGEEEGGANGQAPQLNMQAHISPPMPPQPLAPQPAISAVEVPPEAAGVVLEQVAQAAVRHVDKDVE